MSYAIRKIRKSKWYKHNNIPWLQEGEIQADSLHNLRTKDNRLSVWLVDAHRTNFEEIIALLATSNTDTLSHIDYALIDISILDFLGIKNEQTPGDSPNIIANSDWHLDLIELTSEKICKLAQLIIEEGEIDRIMEDEVIQYVKQGLNNRVLDKQKIKPTILDKVI